MTARSEVTEYRDPWCLSTSAGRTSVAIVPETPHVVAANTVVMVTVQTGKQPHLRVTVQMDQPFRH